MRSMSVERVGSCLSRPQTWQASEMRCRRSGERAGRWWRRTSGTCRGVKLLAHFVANFRNFRNCLSSPQTLTDLAAPLAGKRDEMMSAERGSERDDGGGGFCTPLPGPHGLAVLLRISEIPAFNPQGGAHFQTQTQQQEAAAAADLLLQEAVEAVSTT